MAPIPHAPGHSYHRARCAMRCGCLRLVKRRLERTDAAGHPVEDIVLSADKFLPLGDTQLELLDGGKRRRRRLGRMRWTSCVRAWAIAAVRQLGLNDDHRPEHAWCVVNGKIAELASSRFPERPLWLVEPKPHPQLAQDDSANRSGSRPAGGTSRTSAATTSLEAPDGSRLWLFRDANKDAWYLHGLWA